MSETIQPVEVATKEVNEVELLKEIMHDINKSIMVTNINVAYLKRKKAHVEIMNAPPAIIQHVNQSYQQVEEQLADLGMKQDICAKMLSELLTK